MEFVYQQEMIEQYVHWNEDIGEWQLKCVAYTGNNMRKQSPLPEKTKVCLRRTAPSLHLPTLCVNLSAIVFKYK